MKTSVVVDGVTVRIDLPAGLKLISQPIMTEKGMILEINCDKTVFGKKEIKVSCGNKTIIRPVYATSNGCRLIIDEFKIDTLNRVLEPGEQRAITVKLVAGNDVKYTIMHLGSASDELIPLLQVDESVIPEPYASDEYRKEEFAITLLNTLFNPIPMMISADTSPDIPPAMRSSFIPPMGSGFHLPGGLGGGFGGFGPTTKGFRSASLLEGDVITSWIPPYPRMTKDVLVKIAGFAPEPGFDSPPLDFKPFDKLNAEEDTQVFRFKGDTSGAKLVYDQTYIKTPTNGLFRVFDGDKDVPMGGVLETLFGRGKRFSDSRYAIQELYIPFSLLGPLGEVDLNQVKVTITDPLLLKVVEKKILGAEDSAYPEIGINALMISFQSSGTGSTTVQIDGLGGSISFGAECFAPFDSDTGEIEIGFSNTPEANKPFKLIIPIHATKESFLKNFHLFNNSIEFYPLSPEAKNLNTGKPLANYITPNGAKALSKYMYLRHDDRSLSYAKECLDHVTSSSVTKGLVASVPKDRGRIPFARIFVLNKDPMKDIINIGLELELSQNGTYQIPALLPTKSDIATSREVMITFSTGKKDIQVTDPVLTIDSETGKRIITIKEIKTKKGVELNAK